ncbi:MAG TPA: type II secretion system protein [Candidatus Udaeobacter sp.]|jgi:prepilin-type N-terminal cleavage/methylation domain-containing protein|nr:type II secretion system protein [Candidatus Udaeobacter sp.]
MARNSHFARAFTLIELIVVLAIIAILMSMVYPMYTSISERAKATKDMSNLRQIGLATQTYLNDSDGVLFSPATPWTSQLNSKYFSAWRGFQSPFDKRPSSEAGTGTPVSPISYGVNANIVSGTAAISASTIRKPTVFILFAPAQTSAATVSFSGRADSPLPGVTVAAATSSPGGVATGGTQNNRQRINALFADLHSETMLWTTFTRTGATTDDPDAPLRWNP